MATIASVGHSVGVTYTIAMTMEVLSSGSNLPSTATERLWRGLGSAALGQIITAASSILLVPLFLRAWGVAKYGWWVSLTALVSYLSLLDLGGQSFIGNLLADSYVRKDETQFRQRFSEGVSLFVVISLVGLLMLSSILLLPGLSLPGRGVPLILEERLIIFMLGALALIAIPGGVYVTAYRATGRLARGMMVGNLTRAGTFFVLSALLFVGSGPMLYASATLTAGLVFAVAVVIDLQRQVPASRKIALSLDMARAGCVHLGGSLYFWLLALASALNFQGVILVLGIYTSWETVAVYATHRTASGLIGYIGNLIQFPLWSELTFLHVQGRREDVAHVALLAAKIVTLLSGFAALGLWFFLPTIYPLWTGGQLNLQPILLSIFLIQGVLMAGWSTSAWSLLSSNQHRPLALWSIANAMLTILLAVILGSHFSAVGVVLATLLGDIICGFSTYPRLAARCLGLPVDRVYIAIMRPLAALLPLGIILLLVSPWFVSWQGVCAGVAVGLSLLYPTARLALGQQDLELLYGMIQSLTGNRM